MNYTNRLFRGLVACGIAFAMVISLAAQAKDEVAKAVRIKGTARYRVGAGEWQLLKVGDVLRPGAMVQTDDADGSYVDLVIGDSGAPVASSSSTLAVTAPSKGGLVRFQPATQQNALRVFERTVLGIDKLTATETGADMVTETQLDLKAGHILGNVKKMNAASRYEIKLPNGVAGVRGTLFHLWADGRLTVDIGAMVLSLVDPAQNVKTREVMGGQHYNPSVDQVAPADPGELRSMQSILKAMAVTTVLSQPVILDRTTYYVQPVLSPTEGATQPPATR